MSEARLEALAEELFVARSLEAGSVGAERGSRLSLADIHAFLTDHTVKLSVAQHRLLFADARARAAYTRLKRELAVWELPAVVAASSGGTTKRTFAGGTIEVRPSRIERQVYVMIRLDAEGRGPRALIMESTSGQIVRAALPAPDEQGGIVLIKNLDDEDDGRLVALIADPNATGALLE